MDSASDQYHYSFDLNYEYDNYANLPSYNNGMPADSASHYQVYHHQEQPQQQPTSQQYHSVPPTSLNSQNIVNVFMDLAKTADVKLSKRLTKHILTLIRLGVPSDDIYLFLKECVKSENRV